MATIFKPSSDKEFFAPFGPTIGYFRMPDNLVDYLNKAIKKKLEDHSRHLVGKVSQELKFDDETKKFVGQQLLNFIAEYHNYTKQTISMGHENLGSLENYSLKINEAWFIRQFEHEYNPTHIHANCAVSSVGYLSLPKNIEQEWEEDYKQMHKAGNGHLNFIYGNQNSYSNGTFLVKPQVGDYYIFPSDLYHCVYPFYTPGERRSFSINMTFGQLTKWDYLFKIFSYHVSDQI